eukprot:TRINITY_DN47235_c0_g1_i1.p1 TRINITY_DN47235_c0_g1~~TRINITY_DN47235_c0_g1_i1.p1  ORF type:complete len:173 (+),score=27.80 TRINITY_DN47235_c0_g1_i1:59-577(+)
MSGYRAMVDLSEEERAFCNWKVDVGSFVVGILCAAFLNYMYTIVWPTENLRFLFGSALMLSGVGAEYFGCALMQGNFKNVFLELNVFILVPALIAVGMAMETPLVAGIWLFHPIYDLLHHPAYMVDLAAAIGATKVHPKMSWFPSWCAGVDVVQGSWILYHFLPEDLSFNLL